MITDEQLLRNLAEDVSDMAPIVRDQLSAAGRYKALPMRWRSSGANPPA